jgi:hypothetical protein
VGTRTVAEEVGTGVETEETVGAGAGAGTGVDGNGISAEARAAAGAKKELGNKAYKSGDLQVCVVKLMCEPMCVYLNPCVCI